MTSEPSKTNATLQSTIGGAKEMVGSMLGQSEIEKDGAQQKTKGDAEYKAAQAEGYAQGTKDQVGGKIDQVAGAVKGDTAQELAGKTRNEKGQQQQELNKPSV